jgi:hypothetical protein
MAASEQALRPPERRKVADLIRSGELFGAPRIVPRLRRSLYRFSTEQYLINAKLLFLRTFPAYPEIISHSPRRRTALNLYWNSTDLRELLRKVLSGKGRFLAPIFPHRVPGEIPGLVPIRLLLEQVIRLRGWFPRSRRETFRSDQVHPTAHRECSATRS